MQFLICWILFTGVLLNFVIPQHSADLRGYEELDFESAKSSRPSTTPPPKRAKIMMQTSTCRLNSSNIIECNAGQDLNVTCKASGINFTPTDRWSWECNGATVLTNVSVSPSNASLKNVSNILSGKNCKCSFTHTDELGRKVTDSKSACIYITGTNITGCLINKPSSSSTITIGAVTVLIIVGALLLFIAIRQ